MDGEAALQRAREGRPDVILLDLLTHVMGGQETLRRLRLDPCTSDIPVILTTGETGQASLEGAAEMLMKPILPEALLGPFYCSARTSTWSP